MKQNRQHYYPELGGPPSITQQWLYTFKVDTPLSTLKHHALNDKWYYQSQKRKKYERKKKQQQEDVFYTLRACRFQRIMFL